MGKRILTTGASESGKSVLMMDYAAALINDGILPVVHSPMALSQDWPDGSEVYMEEEEYILRVEQLAELSRRAGKPVPVALFIDEADEVLSINQKYNHWILTRGRHYFPVIVVITQRPKMVAPNVRGQCKDLYLFQISSDDAKELSKDFACDLGEAPHLLQGEYLWVRWKDRKKEVERIDGFDKSKVVDSE